MSLTFTSSLSQVWDGGDEEEDFSSPIDDIDQLDFFSDTLRTAFQREPEVSKYYSFSESAIKLYSLCSFLILHVPLWQVYHRIQESLSPEIKSICQQLFIASDSKRVKNN